MEQKTGVSFSFSKTKGPVNLKSSAIAETDGKPKEDTDYLTSVEKNEIQSVKPKQKKKGELVIPLISHNKWKNPKRPDDLENEQEAQPEAKKRKLDKTEGKDVDSVENAAINELLKEAAAEGERWDERGVEGNSERTVPLLMQNKVPAGFETDDRLDVQLRPDEPEEANYEEVPIEEYGMALLRGMGFSQNQGIGKNSKVFKPIDAVARPKGLGLGADRSKVQQVKHGLGRSAPGQAEEQLVMKKGACALVTSGASKDLYGEIVGLDEDNNRAMVKMTLSGETISISQNAVQLVSKSEYSKYSKYLNKSKADKYKAEDSDSKHRHKKHKKHRHSDHSDPNTDSDNQPHNDPLRDSHGDSHRDHSKSKDSYRDRNENRDSDREHHKKHKSSKHHKQDKHKKENGHSGGQRSRTDRQMRPEDIWMRSHLRVRIVDPDLKKGKYFKSKVVIEDVIGFNSCVVRTDQGKLLEDLQQSQLETVIPRTEPGYVMLLSGTDKSAIGEILRKDKSACIATVQLLSDRSVIVEAHYDNICEYTGDVSTQADF